MQKLQALDDNQVRLMEKHIFHSAVLFRERRIKIYRMMLESEIKYVLAFLAETGTEASQVPRWTRENICLIC